MHPCKFANCLSSNNFLSGSQTLREVGTNCAGYAEFLFSDVGVTREQSLPGREFRLGVIQQQRPGFCLTKTLSQTIIGGMVMSTENRQYLSTKDAAEMLKVSQVRVRQFCQDGRIGQKVGDRYLILREEVLQFMRKDRPVGRPTEN